MTSQEEIVWTGYPSQITNFWYFVFGILLFFLIIPPLITLWKWLVVKNIKFELTTERLKTHSGVLNKQTDDMELYRVRDYRIERPLFLRLFSLGNVILMTSDKTTPTVVISAIKKSEEVREKIRPLVEARRDAKKVREIDFE